MLGTSSVDWRLVASCSKLSHSFECWSLSYRIRDRFVTLTLNLELCIVLSQAKDGRCEGDLVNV